MESLFLQQAHPGIGGEDALDSQAWASLPDPHSRPPRPSPLARRGPGPLLPSQGQAWARLELEPLVPDLWSDPERIIWLSEGHTGVSKSERLQPKPHGRGGMRGLCLPATPFRSRKCLSAQEKVRCLSRGSHPAPEEPALGSTLPFALNTTLAGM